MTFAIHSLERKSVKSESPNFSSAELVKKAVELAFNEDLGSNQGVDLTTQAIVDPTVKVTASIYCKEPGVHVAGLTLLPDVIGYLEPACLEPSYKITALVSDGSYISTAPTKVATVQAKTSTVLGAERIALNLLQRLSGITTLTSAFVAQAQPYGIAILDTRKTTPGLRVLEKYAVKLGGGVNHRFGLYDAILIKDNHIAIAGGVTKAIQAVRAKYPKLPIEVECTSLAQVEESLREHVETIMLDNMTPAMVTQATAIIQGKSRVEISGGINLTNISSYLLPGVNAISVGALTHSPKSVDLSLEIEGYL